MRELRKSFWIDRTQIRAFGVAGLLLILFPVVSDASSLRFYGFGQNDVDRVKISIDSPDVPADVGLDYTIEFWMRADPGEIVNLDCNPNVGIFWIRGNIIFDRDVLGNGDYGDYGISLFRDSIGFGVAGSTGSAEKMLCGSADFSDQEWHHVAVTRTQAGNMSIYVDGSRRTQGVGPAGDLSYRDGRSTSYPNSDPFLVIGAEKHDDDPSSFPSYAGWLDEIRISDVVRYSGTSLVVPTGEFAADGNTVALYHFNEGQGNAIEDASPGQQSPGVRKFGGSPTAGPAWSSETPFTGQAGAVQFAIDSYDVSENAGSVIVDVSRSGGSAGNVTVDYRTEDALATAGADYLADTGTLTFENGENTQQISITVLDDVVFEGDEDFLVHLMNPTGGATVGSPGSTTINLSDNESPPSAGTIEFSEAAYAVSEDESNVMLVVSRNGGSAGSVSVDLQSTDLSATDGEDYNAVAGPLDFASGEVSKVVNVTIIDDAVYEGDEQFSVLLENPTGGASLGSATTAIVTVVEDDMAPSAGSLHFGNSSYSGSEGRGAITVVVSRSDGTNGSVTVDYDTSDLTARSGNDYRSATGTLTFADGESSKSLNIDLIDDSLVEGDESFRIELSAPTGSAVLRAPSMAEISIVDDDSVARRQSGGGGGVSVWTLMMLSVGAIGIFARRRVKNK